MSLGLPKCLELNFRGLATLKRKFFSGGGPPDPHIKTTSTPYPATPLNTVCSGSLEVNLTGLSGSGKRLGWDKVKPKIIILLTFWGQYEKKTAVVCSHCIGWRQCKHLKLYCPLTVNKMLIFASTSSHPGLSVDPDMPFTFKLSKQTVYHTSESTRVGKQFCGTTWMLPGFRVSLVRRS